MKTVTYSSQDCCVLENSTLRVLVARSVGPRVLSFGFQDGVNLFADLPDFVTDLPGGGVYHFYGGHRLWTSPEAFETSYISDDSPVDVTELEQGLRVVKPVEPQTGIQKTLEIILTGENEVVIRHHIVNQNSSPVTCAPWAITQLTPGGLAILPQAQHDAGVLPNRSMSLWSYTDMSNPNVMWGRNLVLLSANMDSPFKIGFPNPRGWLAYWLAGNLFVKRAEYHSQAAYYDFGSSSECYCNDQFLELETLAPITTLASGESVTHTETWNLYKDIARPQNENEAAALVDKLKLA